MDPVKFPLLAWIEARVRRNPKPASWARYYKHSAIVGSIILALFFWAGLELGAVLFLNDLWQLGDVALFLGAALFLGEFHSRRAGMRPPCPHCGESLPRNRKESKRLEGGH